MELIIRGRYWSEHGTYKAEIPSIRVKSEGSTADECISSLKKRLDELINDKTFNCQIQLKSGSILNVISDDQTKFKQFLIRAISERASHYKSAFSD